MNAVPVNAIMSISAILPTFNRVAALRENLSTFLQTEGIGELIVVDDCSSDDTEVYLASVNNPLLRVIRHPKNRGSPGARATGISAALFPWILMLEDDCRIPRDYARVLLEVAVQTQASIVGAPWVHTTPEQLSMEVQQRRVHSANHIGLDTHPGTFPTDDIETPFLPALVLAQRELLRTINYDPGYGGNAWREETSLFIAATESGHRCILTPRTYSYQVQQWDGGQRRRRLSYEVWVIYNNWRFLRRHRAFLQAGGYIRSLWREQLRFVTKRFVTLAKSKFSTIGKSAK